MYKTRCIRFHVMISSVFWWCFHTYVIATLWIHIHHILYSAWILPSGPWLYCFSMPPFEQQKLPGNKEGLWEGYWKIIQQTTQNTLNDVRYTLHYCYPPKSIDCNKIDDTLTCTASFEYIESQKYLQQNEVMNTDNKGCILLGISIHNRINTSHHNGRSDLDSRQKYNWMHSRMSDVHIQGVQTGFELQPFLDILENLGYLRLLETSHQDYYRYVEQIL